MSVAEYIDYFIEVGNYFCLYTFFVRTTVVYYTVPSPTSSTYLSVSLSVVYVYAARKTLLTDGSSTALSCIISSATYTCSTACNVAFVSARAIFHVSA